MDTQDVKLEEATPQNINECQADHIGLSGFAECRCAGPNACEFALPFGYAFLCQHPRLNEIVENTKRQRFTSSQAN